MNKFYTKFKRAVAIGITCLAIGAPAITANAQNYVRSSTGEELQSSSSTTFALVTTSTNVTRGTYQLGYGGDGTFAFATYMSATNSATSNVVFTLAFSMDPDVMGFADTTTTVTNALNGTNIVRYLNRVTSAQFRYVKITAVSTTAAGTSGVKIRTKFGQHRPGQ